MTPPTDAILETIGHGLAEGATAEQRQAAAQVCRAALAVFERTPASTAAPELPLQPGDHVGQLLDALIARLKLLPPRGSAAPVSAPVATGTPTAAVPAARPARRSPVPFVPTRRRAR